jgi:hypothetical protein
MLARTKTRNENENKKRERKRVLVLVLDGRVPPCRGSGGRLAARVDQERAGLPLGAQIVGRPRAESAPRRDGGVATVHGHADFPRVVEPR